MISATPRKGERIELCALFCLHAHAIALWYVPFSNVLTAHGLGWLTPYAFACSALAAFISPMISGTLADRHASPERVLRWLAVGLALFLALTFRAIECRWGAMWVLAFLQMTQLCSAPTWGLSSAIVLSRLREPEREFGPVRAWASFGWMLAGPLLSFVLMADASVRSGYFAAVAWLAVAAFTLLLPTARPRAPAPGRRWTELFGWETLSLLRDRDHRAVFVGAALFSIPLAAFYPFTAIHLRELGESRISAAMSLGQVTEIAGMFLLAPLLVRFRLKAVFLAGMAFAVARYALFALDARMPVLIGIALHGFCFTLFFIPAQIYLEKRIDPSFRVRAQALLAVMMSGVGNLLGALGTGWWLAWCRTPGEPTRWSLYWAVLSGVTLLVTAFFAFNYRGRGRLSASGEPAIASRFIAQTPE